MAKRKKSRRKKTIDLGPKHILPVGFWAQFTAVFLGALAVMFVIAWFNSGGPLLDWIYKSSMSLIGYGVYIVPALFIYIAIEIFRAEDNRLPYAVRFASFLEILWVSALLGIPASQSEVSNGGGIIGQLINKGMLQLVNTNVAIFIYILLIAVTLLFMSSSNPKDVALSIWGLLHRGNKEDEQNSKVMRNAASLDGTISRNFKLTEGVPVVQHQDRDKPNGKRSSSRDNSSMDHEKDLSNQPALMTVSDPNWEAPSLDLLEKKEAKADAGDYKQNAAIIQNTLHEFGIEVEMDGANVGPKVTQFELRPPSGVKLARITALETNIALNLAAKSLRIEAPIPGKKVVGVEVPNVKAADVRVHSIINSKQWRENTEPLAFAIGKDIAGEPIIGELNKMPHLLIAGQTGSGKSVMINTLLTSLLYRNSPSELKLILVDPKQVEMTQYDDIPHLLTPVITDVEKTISALKWAVQEMEKRYTLLSKNRVKDIKTYNQKIRSSNADVKITDADGNPQDHKNGAMPYIVIVVDELADFMMAAGRDMESLIARLAQKARAVGIHLVLATQTPRADIITGLIKANISARIAFTVPSQLESRIILDQGGAEKLLGSGDMLYVTASMPKPTRIQGAWVTDDEISKVTAHLHMQGGHQYNDDVISQKVHLNGKGGTVSDFGGGSDEDPLFEEAVQMVINNQKATASSLQRRFKLGYNRAARLIDYMEEQGIVGPANGQKPREVLIDSMDDINGPDDVDQSDDL